MRKDFLVFGAPLIGQEEIEEITDVLKSGWIGTGPRVKKFESDFIKYKEAPYAVAVNSCTAGLHLSLLAAGVGRGDEVITTPLTFCATVNSIIHCGATPVLVDVDPNTMNINAKEIEKAISKRTKAILPVHFGGRLCDMTDISKIAEQYNLDIIEDCAHAVETEKKGQKAGSFGRFAVFSFYATKNLVTGEGGMVLCQNEQDATRIKQLSLHGMSHDAWKRFSGSGYKHYSVVEAGYKYNMTDMQAALGIHQLARINTNYKRRKEIWEFYNREFENLPIITPKQEENDSKHALHLYTILMTKGGPARDNFITQMTEQNIGVGVHYESVAEHPYYQQNYHWKAENWPHAMDIGRRTVSLPISAALSDKDVCDVVGAVKNIVLKRRVVDRHVAV